MKDCNFLKRAACSFGQLLRGFLAAAPARGRGVGPACLPGAAAPRGRGLAVAHRLCLLAVQFMGMCADGASLLLRARLACAWVLKGVC